MHFWVVSLFPPMFDALCLHGITGRAVAEKKASVHLINPRDFSKSNYRRVDDTVFGGGPGMVMMIEPLAQAIAKAKSEAQVLGLKNCPVVYLSPQGQPLSESSVGGFLQLDGMILLCGRYEGVDERLIERYVDMEISIGDYVLTGGELPAMVLMDSVIRRLPAVMNDERSAQEDSFVDGLLDCAHYTKPLVFEGMTVPCVLRSGNHQNIAKWRFLSQLKHTKTKRPDLFDAFLQKKSGLSAWQQQCLVQFLVQGTEKTSDGQEDGTPSP